MLATLGRSPLILEYDFTQESQLLLHIELSSQLSTTMSFERVYRALLVGYGRLLTNKEFQSNYRDGLRPAEIYEADLEVDP